MHGHYHAIARTLSQQHFSSCFVALLLSKRLLPANPPLSIHIALSFILSLWQIIGSSKVAIPNCLYTHNSSPSIQATVHPSILPSSHPAIPSSYFLFLFLSLPSPWWWCITVTAIAISALYLVYYDKLLLKKGHIHTHMQKGRTQINCFLICGSYWG